MGLLIPLLISLQSINNLMTAFAKLDVALPVGLLHKLHDCMLQRSATASAQVGQHAHTSKDLARTYYWFCSLKLW